MKLKLIVPTWGDPRRRRMKGKAFRFPQIAPTIIAALTPKDAEVTITDENVEDIDFDEEADLVGITAMTATAPRAYRIADEFRRRGVKVVLGGMHPSALPQEAIQHSDAVVIGEAEGCWYQVIQDFRGNNLQPFYFSPTRPSLRALPIPRRDLLKKDAYLLTSTLQTTRGCPFNCSFCSVTTFFGKTYRTRPVQEVIQEIRSLKARLVGFLDDNIVGDVRYAKELFKVLIAEGIKWVGQSSLNIVNDLELLKLAQRSGCKGLFIGFESLSSASLKEVGKGFLDVARYKEAIAKLHDHGIAVLGAFIFGMDHDGPDVFERTVEFAQKSKLDLAQFGILTPFPGTLLFKRLEQENRIITRDWTKYDIGNVVFKPTLMRVEQLKEGMSWAWRQFYSRKSILSRVLGLGKRFFNFALPLWIINTSYKKMLD